MTYYLTIIQILTQKQSDSYEEKNNDVLELWQRQCLGTAQITQRS